MNGSRKISGIAAACLGLLAASTLSSCITTHCATEKIQAAPEKRFVETRFVSRRDDGSTFSYPVWHTKTASDSPVLLLHALNGISPRTIELALEMEAWGHRVYVPSLYGETVRGEEAFGYDDALRATKYINYSDDWRVYQVDGPGRILDDVRAMSRWVSQKENGRQLAVVGNCLTGIFPLGLMGEPHIRTGVIAQPASPLKKWYHVIWQVPQLPWHNPALGLSYRHLHAGLDALEKDPHKRLYGFHYSHDPLASFSKFENLNGKLERRGISDQFRTVILAPAADVPRLREASWTVVEEAHCPADKLSPHSTIINPGTDRDRIWFREKLRMALAGNL